MTSKCCPSSPGVKFSAFAFVSDASSPRSTSIPGAPEPFNSTLPALSRQDPTGPSGRSSARQSSQICSPRSAGCQSSGVAVDPTLVPSARPGSTPREPTTVRRVINLSLYGWSFAGTNRRGRTWRSPLIHPHVVKCELITTAGQRYLLRKHGQVSDLRRSKQHRGAVRAGRHAGRSGYGRIPHPCSWAAR